MVWLPVVVGNFLETGDQSFEVDAALAKQVDLEISQTVSFVPMAGGAWVSLNDRSQRITAENASELVGEKLFAYHTNKAWTYQKPQILIRNSATPVNLLLEGDNPIITNIEVLTEVAGGQERKSIRMTFVSHRPIIDGDKLYIGCSKGTVKVRNLSEPVIHMAWEKILGKHMDVFGSIVGELYEAGADKDAILSMIENGVITPSEVTGNWVEEAEAWLQSICQKAQVNRAGVNIDFGTNDYGPTMTLRLPVLVDSHTPARQTKVDEDLLRISLATFHGPLSKEGIEAIDFSRIEELHSALIGNFKIEEEDGNFTVTLPDGTVKHPVTMTRELVPTTGMGMGLVFNILQTTPPIWIGKEFNTSLEDILPSVDGTLFDTSGDGVIIPLYGGSPIAKQRKIRGPEDVVFVPKAVQRKLIGTQFSEDVVIGTKGLRALNDLIRFGQRPNVPPSQLYGHVTDGTLSYNRKKVEAAQAVLLNSDDGELVKLTMKLIYEELNVRMPGSRIVCQMRPDVKADEFEFDPQIFIESEKKIQIVDGESREEAIEDAREKYPWFVLEGEPVVVVRFPVEPHGGILKLKAVKGKSYLTHNCGVMRGVMNSSIARQLLRADQDGDCLSYKSYPVEDKEKLGLAYDINRFQSVYDWAAQHSGLPKASITNYDVAIVSDPFVSRKALGHDRFDVKHEAIYASGQLFLKGAVAMICGSKEYPNLAVVKEGSREDIVLRVLYSLLKNGGVDKSQIVGISVDALDIAEGDGYITEYIHDKFLEWSDAPEGIKELDAWMAERGLLVQNHMERVYTALTTSWILPKYGEGKPRDIRLASVFFLKSYVQKLKTQLGVLDGTFQKGVLR
jgi:hypothetical protein